MCVCVCVCVCVECVVWSVCVECIIFNNNYNAFIMVCHGLLSKWYILTFSWLELITSIAR